MGEDSDQAAVLYGDGYVRVYPDHQTPQTRKSTVLRGTSGAGVERAEA